MIWHINEDGTKTPFTQEEMVAFHKLQVEELPLTDEEIAEMKAERDAVNPKKWAYMMKRLRKKLEP